MRVVLDASALLALINNESRVEEVLSYLQDAIISAFNVSEVATVLCDLGLFISEIDETLTGLIQDIARFDLEQSLMTASLRKITREKGLSLGDRACLALGKTRNLIVLTADKI